MEVPLYDPNYVDELMNEGMSWKEAVYEASVTMAGAYENEGGGIHSTQTYCDELHYKEGLGRSREQIEAQRMFDIKIRDWIKDTGVHIASKFLTDDQIRYYLKQND